jgi:two-component system, NarL family, nitrate/nitrite response regulator NarL
VPTRVLIIVPVRLYREGLEHALACDERLEVVGSTASAAEIVPLLDRHEVDSLVLDVAAAGPSLVRELTASRPRLRVIALALAETPPNVIEWAEAGIAGFVTEDGTVSDLVRAIIAAAHDELVCSPLTAGALLRHARRRAHESHPGASLSPREVQIAQLVEQGLMNKEIASRLGIELTTVKNHVHRILEKLGVHRRADAAAHIRSSGLAMRD